MIDQVDQVVQWTALAMVVLTIGCIGSLAVALTYRAVQWLTGWPRKHLG